MLPGTTLSYLTRISSDGMHRMSESSASHFRSNAKSVLVFFCTVSDLNLPWHLKYPGLGVKSATQKLVGNVLIFQF